MELEADVFHRIARQVPGLQNNLSRFCLPGREALVQFPAHHLADRTMVSIRELDREQFILYPPTAESAIRDFQLCNLQDSGIHYTLYDGDTSTLFYKLLVPIGKGLLLRPTPMMDVPPNAVCLPVTGLPHPATMCFFFDKANPKADVQAFARDFPNFAKEVAKREHRQAL